MSDARADWVAVLDSLEAEAEASQHQPEGRRPAAFAPPDLRPLPPELAERARHVLATIEAASAIVQAELDRTAEQLRDLGRHDPRGPKPASSFDTKA